MCSPVKVYCFVCFKGFSKNNSKSKKCKECGDFKCPLFKGCVCDLTLGEQRVALAMIKTYEPLLGGIYKFSVHRKVEDRVKDSMGEVRK